MTNIRYILALLVSAMALTTAVSAVDVSISSGVGSSTMSFGADLKDSVSSTTILSQSSLEHSTSGSGSFKEDHWIDGVNNAKSGVGVDIVGSEDYQYSYRLTPPQEGLIEAHQNLNARNATRIDAYAEARASNVSSRSDISVLGGSLRGYSATAVVTDC